MIVYQLTFKSLPRFEKYFSSQDSLFSYLDEVEKTSKLVPVVKVRDMVVKEKK